MANLLASVSYNGKYFYGWQAQPKYKNTVQEEIETLLSKLLNEKITIFGAGRTDKGVHAYKQYFNFHINKEMNINRLKYAFNRLIGPHIKINDIKEVSEDFHARYYAKKKIYLYKINDEEKNPFEDDLVYQLNRKLDIDEMTKASKYFLGEHSFKNFTTKKEDNKNYIRIIESIEIKKNNGVLDIVLTGNGFMRYMVRMIVGVLIKVGLHKIQKEKIISLLDESLPKDSVPKAPAEGLYLVDVIY